MGGGTRRSGCCGNSADDMRIIGQVVELGKSPLYNGVVIRLFVITVCIRADTLS